MEIEGKGFRGAGVARVGSKVKNLKLLFSKVWAVFGVRRSVFWNKRGIHAKNYTVSGIENLTYWFNKWQGCEAC